MGVFFCCIINGWIDYCIMYDISDDLMCVIFGLDKVILLYNYFYFINEWLNMKLNFNIWNWVGKN